jgi:hypothetical protein
MHYTSEPLVVEQLHQLMELPETNKSSVADKLESREKANWMQVRETALALVHSCIYGGVFEAIHI